MKYPLDRRDFIKAMGVGTVALSFSCLFYSKKQPEKFPNIVIIVADDLGWKDVGYHGSEIKTPRLDQFVRQSMELDRFYVTPICSPTRCGLMTGRYPHRFGMRRAVITPWRKWGLPSEEETIAEILTHVGYKHRVCIGKWHLGHHKRRYHPLNRGFTYFYGHYNGYIDYFSHKREGELDFHKGFQPCYDEGYLTRLCEEQAIRFIENTPSHEPFFLYLPFSAPHAPLQAEEEDLKLYGFDKNKEMLPTEGFPYSDKGGGNTKRQTHAAMVTALDRSIGNILDALEKKGVRDKTLVVFFSDNGGEIRIASDNSPLSDGKHSVLEGGVRVPAAISWPGKVPVGKKYSGIAGYIDILPTILGISGFSYKPRNELDGIDLIDSLSGKKPEPDRVFYLGQGAVVSRKWKYHRRQDCSLLFEIEKDPSEKNNVIEKYPEIAARYEEYLKRFESWQSQNQIPRGDEGREGFVAPKEWEITEE